VEAKFGRQRSPVRKEAKRDDVEDKFSGGEKPRKEKENKEKKAAVAPVGQEMIIVKVNDRLGTAAQIPCLASDPISECSSIPRLLGACGVILICANCRIIQSSSCSPHWPTAA